MRNKKVLAAVAALGLVGGFGTTLINQTPANAFPASQSCVADPNSILCLLTTDYFPFSPVHDGDTHNNTLLLGASPIGAVDVEQFLSHNIIGDDDDSNGTAVTAILPIGYFQSALAHVEQFDAENHDCVADECAHDKGFLTKIGLDLLPGDVSVSAMQFSHAPDNPTDADESYSFFIAGANLDPAFGPDTPIQVVFDSEEGCSLILGPAAINICQDRTPLSEAFHDAGLHILEHIVEPLDAPSNGPIVPFTPTNLVNNPIPPLPVVPFLPLP